MNAFASTQQTGKSPTAIVWRVRFAGAQKESEFHDKGKSWKIIAYFLCF